MFVRAGKRFVCGACGTLVEIPDDAVGQLVSAIEPAPQKTSESKSRPASVPSATKASPEITPQPKPKLPLPRKTFVGKVIDGLRVPSGVQLDRALAWVAFHLKVLDRQGAEKKRLQKLGRNYQQRQRCAPSTSHFDEKPTRCAKPKPSPQHAAKPKPNQPATSQPPPKRRSGRLKRQARASEGRAPKRRPHRPGQGIAVRAKRRRRRSTKGRGPP